MIFPQNLPIVASHFVTGAVAGVVAAGAVVLVVVTTLTGTDVVVGVVTGTGVVAITGAVVAAAERVRYQFA